MPQTARRSLKTCIGKVWILRCRLLKVGAVIIRNTRSIRFFLASAFPHQQAFLIAAQRFASGYTPPSAVPVRDDINGLACNAARSF